MKRTPWVMQCVLVCYPFDYSGYCKYLWDILCIVCTQRFKSNHTLVQHLVSLQLLKQNNFIFIEFQFHITKMGDLKFFAIRVQYIQWGMLE